MKGTVDESICEVALSDFIWRRPADSYDKFVFVFLAGLCCMKRDFVRLENELYTEYVQVISRPNPLRDCIRDLQAHGSRAQRRCR